MKVHRLDELSRLLLCAEHEAQDNVVKCRLQRPEMSQEEKEWQRTKLALRNAQIMLKLF